MHCKLVKLHQYSGEKASVYSLNIEKYQKTLFDIFLEENTSSFKSEIKEIMRYITLISTKTGARTSYFKEQEGGRGSENLFALFDETDRNLRLYCLKYGTEIIILGGGGYKDSSISALQDDPKLKKENYILRSLCREIDKRIREGNIEYTADYLDFVADSEDDFEFEIEIK